MVQDDTAKNGWGIEIKGVVEVDNFYIAFAVYLNLIFVAAKLWDKIGWSWIWVMLPLIILTVIGAVAATGQAAKKKELRGNLIQNLQSLREMVESSKERRGDKH